MTPRTEFRKDSFSPPRAGFLEGWIKLQMGIHIHGQIRRRAIGRRRSTVDDSILGDFCAVLEWPRGLDGENLKRQILSVFRAKGIILVGRQGDIDECEETDGQLYSPMLIRIPKAFKHPHGVTLIAPTELARLKLLEACPYARVDPPEPGLGLMHPVRDRNPGTYSLRERELHFSHWKLDRSLFAFVQRPPRLGPETVKSAQFPCEVVEGAPQVVDDFTNCDPPIQEGDGAVERDHGGESDFPVPDNTKASGLELVGFQTLPQDCVEGPFNPIGKVELFLGQDTIRLRVRVEELGDLFFKSLNAIICPISLGPSATKSTSSHG